MKRNGAPFLWNGCAVLAEYAGIVREVSGDVKDFYELTDLKRYTEEMGLDLSVELGKALFV